MTLRQSVPQRRVSEENGDSYGRFPGKCGRRSVVALVSGHGRRRHCRCSVRYSSAAQTASGLCPVGDRRAKRTHFGKLIGVENGPVRRQLVVRISDN